MYTFTTTRVQDMDENCQISSWIKSNDLINILEAIQ